MGTITERPRKNGSSSFTAQIRKKQGGRVVLNLVETFCRHQDAERWMKRQEQRLKKPGALERACCDPRH